MQVRLPNNQFLTLKHRSWLCELLVRRKTHIPVGDTLYVSKQISLETISLSTLIHIQVHSMQQKQLGIYKWFFFYAFSPSFRYWQEVEAYARQINFTFGKAKKRRLIVVAAMRLKTAKYKRYTATKSLQNIESDIKLACTYRDFI